MTDDTEDCCAEFTEHGMKPPYPSPQMDAIYAATGHERPWVGTISQNHDGTWSVAGCCGSCSVIETMRFCPFCGTKLDATPAEESPDA